MKNNILKQCVAAILAVCVLSTGITVSAAQSAPNPDSIAQSLYGDVNDPAVPTPPGAASVPYDQYLGALLDVFYRNDSRAFVALGLGTAEEAALLYNSVLDSELISLELDNFIGMECPESLENDFRTAMMQMLGGARYAVAGCELQADGTYQVTIVYEQMIIFEPLMNLYIVIVTDMATKWFDGSVPFPSDEEMMIQLLAALYSSLNVCLQNVTYAPPALTTVSIEPVDGAYYPNLDDISRLQALLFDTDAVMDF